MRPLVVVLLVLVAVGALAAALFTVLSTDGGSDRGAAVRNTGERPAEGPSVRDGDAPLVTGPREVPAEDREVAVSASTNPGGNAPTGNWSNEVSIEVLDTEGRPLPGAKLTFVRQSVPTHLALLQVAGGSSDDYWPVYGTTGEEGTYRFRGLEPANNWTLSIQHEDYAFKERGGIQVARTGETRIQIQLQQGVVCQGWVLDTSGNAIEGAELELMSQMAAHIPGSDPRAHRDTLRGTSDATGYFEIANIAPGNRLLSVRAEGYGAQTRNNLNFTLDRESTEVTFKLDLGLCIAGRVFGPDLVGIEGAQIEAISYQTAISSKGVATAGADGYFEICDLSPGTYVVIVRSNGLKENRDHTRVEAGNTNLQVEMARLGSVMGRVVDATGSPLRLPFQIHVRQVSANAAVYGRPMYPSSYDNAAGTGEFEVGGLDQATYVIQAVAQGYAPSFSDTFTVTQGITTPDVEVRMSQGGVISGYVVDAGSREPVAGARIATFDNTFVANPFTEMLGNMIPRMTADVKAITNDEGYFEMAGLNQETYQLQISSPEHATKVLKDRLVVNGATDDLGTITLARGAVVRGTVYDAAGQPLPGAEVQMNSNNSLNLGRSFRTIADQSGRYEFKSVNAGTYKVTAVRGDDGGNPFDKILDMKNSETNVTVSEGSAYQRDLHLGG